MPGALQRRRHRAKGAVAVRRRRGDVIGVARQAVADELGINLRAARLGMLVDLEHHAARALAHDETVAIAIIGARGLLRPIVESGRKRLAGGKAGNADAVDRRFRAARDHDIGVFERDDARRIADRVRAGRTGRDDGMIGSLETMHDRDMAAREIDQAAGNEERRDAARALLVQQ